MDGFFLYYMKSAFTMLKYRVFSYDANERILFMKLGSGMYKEIARDALKGNWMKAIAAGFAAGWLGVFSSSFLFIAGYVSKTYPSDRAKNNVIFAQSTLHQSDILLPRR